MCDMEFLPFYINEAGMRLVGLEGVDEACRTPVQEFFFPEDQRFVMEEFFPRVLREGQAETEIRFRHFKTGAPLWMIYNVFYLAMLAHELRTPLAPIRNALHVLRMSGGEGPVAERVRAIMERQVSHMVRLVDDLLEVSRITRGKIELRKEPVELAPVIRNAVETSQPLIDAAHHHLTLDLPAEPLRLDADAVRLAQVFANLLNKAAKYTNAGGNIWLTARRQGSDAVVSVRDNGVGIPAAMLPRVFDLFTQVESGIDRAQGGLGIGLAPVRSLVQLHGGSVEVRSAGPGCGSEFTVRLPVAAGHSAE